MNVRAFILDIDQLNNEIESAPRLVWLAKSGFTHIKHTTVEILVETVDGKVRVEGTRSKTESVAYKTVNGYRGAQRLLYFSKITPSCTRSAGIHYHSRSML